jgi:hypothetical protein
MSVTVAKNNYSGKIVITGDTRKWLIAGKSWEITASWQPGDEIDATDLHDGVMRSFELKNLTQGTSALARLAFY